MKLVKRIQKEKAVKFWKAKGNFEEFLAGGTFVLFCWHLQLFPRPTSKSLGGKFCKDLCGHHLCTRNYCLKADHLMKDLSHQLTGKVHIAFRQGLCCIARKPCYSKPLHQASATNNPSYRQQALKFFPSRTFRKIHQLPCSHSQADRKLSQNKDHLPGFTPPVVRSLKQFIL